jgi:hypothetical protein
LGKAVKNAKQVLEGHEIGYLSGPATVPNEVGAANLTYRCYVPYAHDFIQEALNDGLVFLS